MKFSLVKTLPITQISRKFTYNFVSYPISKETNGTENSNPQ